MRRRGATGARPEVEKPDCADENWTIPAPEWLIEDVLPLREATLLVGPPKSGKTILSMAFALSVAGGSPLLDYYQVRHPGPAMLIEQDDPGAKASVKDIASRSPFVETRRHPVLARFGSVV